jgi:hypothetical protein
MKATIVIGTPTYAEQVTTAYLKSIFALQSHVRKAEPEVALTLLTNSSTSIDLNRNIIATQTLGRADLTHLLFVDSDMGFNPGLIMDMLRFDRPLVGAMCPKRQIDERKLWEAARQVSDPAKMQLIANDYANVSFIPEADGSIRVDQGFARCTAIGAAIMLMKREVLERMAALPGVLLQQGSRRLLQCFQPMTNENGFTLSEDISFCRRWIEGCGGEIWVNVAHQVTHLGTYNYVGQFIEKLNHTSRPTPDSESSKA